MLVGSSDPGDESVRAVLDQPPAHGALEFRTDGSFTYTPVTGFVGLDSFTFHAYDGLNGGNVATATLDVGNTSPPAIVNPGNLTNTEGDTVSLQLHVNEPPGYVVAFLAPGLPPGLSINNATGLISGTVGSTFSQHGPYHVPITAVNSALISATVVITWTVNNIPPAVIGHSYGAGVNDPLIVGASVEHLPARVTPGKSRYTRSLTNRRPMGPWRSISTARSPIPLPPASPATMPSHSTPTTD